MLVNFRFENFLSFNQMNTFSMTLGKTKLHQRNILKNDSIDLLKFATVYGANASGKSNFISTISFAQDIILNGLNNVAISNMYNRNDEANSQRVSRFEFEILLDSKIYSYGFSILISEMKIVEEWFYDITNKEIEIFSRSNDVIFNYDYFNFDENSKLRINVYSQDISSNRTDLFLTSLNKGKNEIMTEDGKALFKDVFNWFSNTLEVISPDEVTKEFGLTYQNQEYLDKLGKYLKNSDTGVTKVLLEKTEDSMEGMPVSLDKQVRNKILQDFVESENESKKVKLSAMIRTPKSIYIFEKSGDELITFELKFVHSKDNVKYSFNEESDGTIRLVELFSVLNNQKEKVFVIDELDRSLHPILTYDFVKKFLLKDGTNQLIISTHEDRLLDLSLLRRDEIWFVNKDDKGNSLLYSLEDYKERFDKNIMNAYLDGRYGAIPKIISNFTISDSDYYMEEGK
ncbi:AAA family ATPase [Lactococcus cremoris]|uniref:AAA family ATPase n=1 Tax=Lactococcus lactis subsp. cremoris TaxID=1359 RepID=UPI0024A79B63|nr:AAA family ATPase [Lactococcus cremoris]